ncbi:hypothetical protein LTS18_001003 [Coniosporium uncinatum]|uniref:Uncharacterized protein n=1 Tax=Coniosporium uncinatum TaxID=93489 RepID=A0ACC3D852_9PEZI|nr:hypothetical protein LTS18_001003 [Coniosporium uncinatum]
MEATFEANDSDVLHMVLDYLHDDPLSIIRASQVCHRWSRVIDLENPLTQQRLVLVSEPETFDPASVEPTFCGRFRRHEYTPDEDGTTPCTPPTPNPDIKIRSNPLLSQFAKILVYERLFVYPRESAVLRFDRNTLRKFPQPDGPSASWRRMLATQLAVETKCFMIGSGEGPLEWSEWERMENLTGITLEDVESWVDGRERRAERYGLSTHRKADEDERKLRGKHKRKASEMLA